MKWLIRLYPRRWRERYGEEFAALLQARPARPRDILDIVRSALEARIFRHSRGALWTREEFRSGKGERAMKVKIAVVATSTILAAAALVLAARVVGFGPFGSTRAAPMARLYALVQSRGMRLFPLDTPALSGGRYGTIDLKGTFDADRGPAEVLQSDDGSMLAVIWTMSNKVRIFDARTGVQRAGFGLPAGVRVQGLSPDGRKLYSMSNRWYTFSTTSGRMVNAVNVHCCAAPYAPPMAYDAARGRLYILEPSQSIVAGTWIQSAFGQGAVTSEAILRRPEAPVSRPGPPRLVAYDSASRQIGHLALNGVTYGSWTGRQWASSQSWTPGFALSPNGRQIAVYDGSTERLTLVDALRMWVLRSESLSRPQSTITRLAQWLGIAPRDALAKGEAAQGADLQMRYSPTGRVLYVTGTEQMPNGGGSSIGIRAIDVATGEVVGEALKDQGPWWAQPAPDGSALYALSLTGDDSEPFPTIFRLDPTTLQVTAKRAVTLSDANPQYYVLAAPTR